MMMVQLQACKIADVLVYRKIADVLVYRLLQVIGHPQTIHDSS